jgi:23S rRNA pseudouridine1911/1915/1917 synthase
MSLSNAEIAKRVLFEDNHILIVNKKSGELVQADKTGDEPLVESAKKYIKEKYNKPGEAFLGVPHRIDRPTSGIIMFARTSKALSRLSEIFKEKTKIKKTYWAITTQNMPEKSGTLINHLYREQSKNKSYVKISPVKGSKEAILHYKVLATSDRYFLVEVVIETGRHHQIRAQLANVGAYIKGDLKYGAPRNNPDMSISLHARALSFEHPVTNETVSVVAPVPDDTLWQFFEKSQQK